MPGGPGRPSAPGRPERPRGPYNGKWQTQAHTRDWWRKRNDKEFCILTTLQICETLQFKLTLSPTSPGLPGAPEEPGGPGRPYFQAKDLIWLPYIQKWTVIFAPLKFLDFILQSGHTWGKGMHEAMWGSLSSCKSFCEALFYLFTTRCLSGSPLWDSICRVSRATVSGKRKKSS